MSTQNENKTKQDETAQLGTQHTAAANEMEGGKRVLFPRLTRSKCTGKQGMTG